MLLHFGICVDYAKASDRRAKFCSKIGFDSYADELSYVGSKGLSDEAMRGVGSHQQMN